MLRPSLRGAALVGSLFVTSVALAGPTGLVLMPIADILKHREAVAEFSLAGTERNVSKAHEYGNAVTVGLYDRVEVGYDADFRGTFAGNAKLLLLEDDKRCPHLALSVGATDWNGGTAAPYVVGRYDGRGYRLHCGCWHTEDANRLMVGSDFPAGPFLSASVEYLSGNGGAAWAGLTYAVPQLPGLEMGLAVGAPTRHADGIQHEVTLAYAFKL